MFGDGDDCPSWDAQDKAGSVAGPALGRRKPNMDDLGIQVLKDTGNISGEEIRCGWVGGDTLHGTEQSGI